MHRFVQLLRAETSEAAAQLRAEDLLDFAPLALLQRFADADDRPQRCVMRGAHLAIHDLIRLAKQLRRSL